MNTSFKYRKAFRIPYRNCLYDSLLELKFALSIEQEYRYLREPFHIGYDPKTLATTDYFKESVQKYKPDFLIRSKTSGKAWLIEIKPNAFASCPEVLDYDQIANHFIRRRHLDCAYKMIYETDIVLQPQQQQKFNLFVKHKHLFTSIFALQELDRKYNAGCTKFFSSVPSFPKDVLSREAYASFVRTGI